MRRGELEQASEGSVERDVQGLEILRCPWEELGGICRLGHRADGGNKGCCVRHLLRPYDGGRLGAMGFRALCLRGLAVVQVKDQAKDGDSADCADWNDCGGPSRSVNSQGGSGRDRAKTGRTEFGSGDSEIKQFGWRRLLGGCLVRG